MEYVSFRLRKLGDRGIDDLVETGILLLVFRECMHLGAFESLGYNSIGWLVWDIMGGSYAFP